MDIRRACIGVSKCTYTNKAHPILCSSVIAPECSLAGRATANLLPQTTLGWDIDFFRTTLNQLKLICFDQCIDCKR